MKQDKTFSLLLSVLALCYLPAFAQQKDQKTPQAKTVLPEKNSKSLHSIEVDSRTLTLVINSQTTIVPIDSMERLIRANRKNISNNKLSIIVDQEASYKSIVNLLDVLEVNKIYSYALSTKSGEKWPETAVSDWDAGEFASIAFGNSGTSAKNPFVLDLEFLFAPEEKASLDSLLKNYEEETGDEIVILTISGEWKSQEAFDNYITKLHNQLGVGKKELNNGILIGISSSNRTLRISNGYGIEARLSDAESKAIIEQYFIPAFKKQAFFEGTKNGVLAILNQLRKTSKKAVKTAA